jgi:PQQ-dependent catabolism-associated beta-propeller protein
MTISVSRHQVSGLALRAVSRSSCGVSSRANTLCIGRRVIDRSSYLYLFVSIILLGACDRGPTDDIERQELAPGEANTSEQEEPQWPAGGDLVYVSNEDSGDISIISTATNQVVKTLNVGRRPRGIRVGNAGKKVFVALSGSPKCPPSMSDEDCNKQETDKTKDGIAIVDVMTANLERVLPGGSDPEQFDLSADNRRLFVSNEDSDQATVVDIDSGQVLKTIAVGREPEGIRVSPDGTLVYVTAETDHDVTVLDADRGTVIATIGVGLRPRDAIFTADGSRAFVSAELAHSIAVIDVSEHKVIATIELDATAKPVGMVATSDNKLLYVANGRGKTVSAIDLNTFKVISSVEVGPRTWGIALTDDEHFLYTANGPSDDVTVVNTETMEVVARIKVGESPWGVAIGPNPRH